MIALGVRQFGNAVTAVKSRIIKSARDSRNKTRAGRPAIFPNDDFSVLVQSVQGGERAKSPSWMGENNEMEVS